jgi:hypothetical protein
MSRGGHNWKGGGTVEGAQSLNVTKLARAGLLAGLRLSSWEWTRAGETTASIQIAGGRDAVTLSYCSRASGEDWQSVTQRVPIWWTACRFGGERPWFVCVVHANGVYCGRRVAKLYVGGRLFACRHCYRLGYAVQRDAPMDRAHSQLARLHRKLAADYDGPDMPPPPKPKWMRWHTYSRIATQIEAGQERLDAVFFVGARRLLARADRSEQRKRTRR